MRQWGAGERCANQRRVPVDVRLEQENALFTPNTFSRDVAPAVRVRGEVTAPAKKEKARLQRACGRRQRTCVQVKAGTYRNTAAATKTSERPRLRSDDRSPSWPNGA